MTFRFSSVLLLMGFVAAISAAPLRAEEPVESPAAEGSVVDEETAAPAAGDAPAAVETESAPPAEEPVVDEETAAPPAEEPAAEKAAPERRDRFAPQVAEPAPPPAAEKPAPVPAKPTSPPRSPQTTKPADGPRQDAAGPVVPVETVSVDDVGNRLLVLIQTARPVESFVFERKDPPSLFVQFLSSNVVASGAPIQVVGTDPLLEIRYGYRDFQDAAQANVKGGENFPLDYIELRLKRPVFYHVQQEGWVLVIGLDRTTAKVEVPDLDFRFDVAKYEGAANVAANPRAEDFVKTAQANSRLLAVARDEADLAKYRVLEARRALYPAVTAKLSSTRGKEVNPFPSDDFEGFEATSFKRDEYGFQITQPIWQSGRLYGAYRQARLNRLMALENLRKQAQDLTYEVKKAYFTLLKSQAIVRVRRQLVAQGEVIKNLADQKLKLNLTSKAESLNVAAQADQASYQLTGDEQDLTLARLVLISLLNQAEQVADPVPGSLSFARLSFNVESIINWAQEHRPDVRIARLNAELARYNMKAAEADQSMKLDASGFIGKAGAAFSEDDYELRDSWNVGLRVSRAFWGNTLRGSFSKEKTAPDLGQSFITESQQNSVEVGLFDSMPGRSNARQAELQYERAKAELVEAGRKAEYEVRETYYNLEKSARQLEAVREDLKFRLKDLEITREKVKLGLAELSQLMAAEVAFAQAAVTEQDALSAYNIALAEMDRVAGAEVVQN